MLRLYYSILEIIIIICNTCYLSCVIFNYSVKNYLLCCTFSENLKNIHFNILYLIK